MGRCGPETHFRRSKRIIWLMGVYYDMKTTNVIASVVYASWGRPSQYRAAQSRHIASNKSEGRLPLHIQQIAFISESVTQHDFSPLSIRRKEIEHLSATQLTSCTLRIDADALSEVGLASCNNNEAQKIECFFSHFLQRFILWSVVTSIHSTEFTLVFQHLHCVDPRGEKTSMNRRLSMALIWPILLVPWFVTPMPSVYVSKVHVVQPHQIIHGSWIWILHYQGQIPASTQSSRIGNSSLAKINS